MKLQAASSPAAVSIVDRMACAAGSHTEWRYYVGGDFRACRACGEVQSFKPGEGWLLLEVGELAKRHIRAMVRANSAVGGDPHGSRASPGAGRARAVSGSAQAGRK